MPPRKLRILCLHGYNTNIEIMKYQLANFTDTFDSLCEFTFIQGIYERPIAPIDFFVQKGVQPPYKSWMYNQYKMLRTLKDGTRESAWSKVTPNYVRSVETIQFIFDFLNIQDEPFDGFIGFSQGVYMIQAVYRTHQYFSKDFPLKHRLPFFVVDFSGPRYDHLTY